MTATNDIPEELAQLDRLIEFLCECYEHLRRITYLKEELQLVTSAVGFITAAGIRHLKAARGDIEGGWTPESAIHIRAAFDATIDLGFLLSLSGENRIGMAGQYHAMRSLRVKMLRKTIEESPERHSRENREQYERLMAEYADSPALDTREHWSGKNRGAVFEAAHGFFDKGLGELGADNLTRTIKRLLIDQIGTVSVHADPAAHLFNIDDDGWPRIEPRKGDSSHVSEYCYVACCLIWGITRRAAGTTLKARASELFEEVGEMMQRRVNPVSEDGSE